MNSVILDELSSLMNKCDYIGRTAQEDLGRTEQRYLSDIWLYLYTQYKISQNVEYNPAEDPIENKPDWLI